MNKTYKQMELFPAPSDGRELGEAQKRCRAEGPTHISYKNPGSGAEPQEKKQPSHEAENAYKRKWQSFYSGWQKKH